MSHLNQPLCLLAAILCTLPVITKVAQAEDSPGPKEILQPRTFESTVRNGEIIGWQQVRRVFVTCGTNQFFFVAPHGLRIDPDPNRVALVSADSTYFLAFRILSTAVAQPNPENTDFNREFLLNQFPGAKVMDEFSETAAGRNGPVCELRVKIAGGVERAVWVALIPSAAGVLEFSLNADFSKSADGRNAFNSLLRTFRSNESGKLEVTAPVPDQS